MSSAASGGPPPSLTSSNPPPSRAVPAGQVAVDRYFVADPRHDLGRGRTGGSGRTGFAGWPSSTRRAGVTSRADVTGRAGVAVGPLGRSVRLAQWRRSLRLRPLSGRTSGPGSPFGSSRASGPDGPVAPVSPVARAPVAKVGRTGSPGWRPSRRSFGRWRRSGPAGPVGPVAPVGPQPLELPVAPVAPVAPAAESLSRPWRRLLPASPPGRWLQSPRGGLQGQRAGVAFRPGQADRPLRPRRPWSPLGPWAPRPLLPFFDFLAEPWPESAWASPGRQRASALLRRLSAQSGAKGTPAYQSSSSCRLLRVDLARAPHYSA